MSRYPTKKPAAKKVAGKKKAAKKPLTAAQKARAKKAADQATRAFDKRLSEAKKRVDKNMADTADRVRATGDAAAQMVRDLSSQTGTLNQLAASTVSAVNFQATVSAKPRFRFLDAVTGLFLRARAALRRKSTTVRERY
jgi:cell pole-organizing protein PopZ